MQVLLKELSSIAALKEHACRAVAGETFHECCEAEREMKADVFFEV